MTGSRRQKREHRKQVKAKKFAANQRKRTAHLIESLQDARDKYSDRWTKNAEAFSRAGDYAWLAAKLAGYIRVLDVGTGDGRGVAHLLEQGHIVVSIDENPSCLIKANQYLLDNKYDSQLILRGNASALQDCVYRINYVPVHSIVPTKGALLIEADVLNDGLFVEWAKRAGPFDAVTCWFVGSHAYRRYNGQIPRWVCDTPQKYRLKMQNTVYELADKVLRESGVLQISDRIEYPHQQCMIDNEWRLHRKQASVTTLHVEDIQYRRIKTVDVVDGVKMGMTAGASGRIPEHIDIAINSVISCKQSTNPVAITDLTPSRFSYQVM